VVKTPEYKYIKLSKEMNTISIIIPTYNSAQYVSNALKSVFQQDNKSFEVIVTDDGSFDGTIKIVEDIFKENPQIKTTLIRNSHNGAGANRNRGIEKAEKEWIAFLDSDDYWYESKLRKVDEKICQYPDIDLWCHRQVADFGHKQKEIMPFKNFGHQQNTFLNLYRQNYLSTSAVVVRRSLLSKLNGFDDSLLSAQDYDLWIRLVIQGCKIGLIQEILGVYSIQEGSISFFPKKMLADELEIGRRYTPYLKLATKWWIFERLRFWGRSYMSCGLILLGQKKYIESLKYILCGFVFWPFQSELFKSAFTKLFKLDRRFVSDNLR
jgi:glycosyltransferase involved in cell wall biosynthesis